ncbi:MAG: NTP transferase domain-containing protein [Planctomycetia bacterium]|nr:MAG: NTP transferase domain-containing protein [Planctomycetia bacterium]
MKPTLMILAAGMGSRYGGLKQVEPVGPNGATIMDYSIHDALQAGFERVVFVIRPDLHDAFRTGIEPRFRGRVRCDYAFQRNDALPGDIKPPPERTRPWGTGHAVLAAAGVIREPFAVINADDFYGAASYRALADFFARPESAGMEEYAMVGFSLADTLSEGGSVSRGVCRVSRDGWLEQITETTGIARDGANAAYTDSAGARHTLPADTPVSMNTWGFRASIFPQLQAGFEAFLRENAGSATAEYYLPAAVQNLVATGRARVRVLPAAAQWCGVTHRADRERVQAMIAGMIARGEYPEDLWK